MTRIMWTKGGNILKLKTINHLLVKLINFRVNHVSTKPRRSNLVQVAFFLYSFKRFCEHKLF